MRTKGEPRPKGSVGYSAVHKQLRRNRLPARNYLCVQCGVPAQQWAWNHNRSKLKVEDRAQNSGLVYTQNLDDYLPMCASCHNKMDKRPWQTVIVKRGIVQETLFSRTVVNFDGTFSGMKI